MCPVCIASTAAIVAGAGSTGGIVAAFIAKFRNRLRKLFSADPSTLFQKMEEK